MTTWCTSTVSCRLHLRHQQLRSRLPAACLLLLLLLLLLWLLLLRHRNVQAQQAQLLGTKLLFPPALRWLMS